MGRRVVFISSHPYESLDSHFGEAIRKRWIVSVLRTNGFEVLPISTADATKSDVLTASPPTLRTWAKKGIPGLLRGSLKDFYYVFVSFRTRWKHAKEVRRFRPDVVFDFTFVLQTAAQKWAAKLGVPLVVVIEGPEPDFRYSFSKSLLRPIAERVEAKRARDADRVIVVSQAMKEFLAGRGTDENKIDIIPTGTDVDDFRPSNERRRLLREHLDLNDNEVVGFAGVFSPWYRLPDLVEAVAKASRARPRIHLLLVGDGITRPEIEDRARASRIDDKITITGFVHHDEVPGYMDAMDLTVIPAHEWWTSPMKLFEYGAARKPVIAGDARSITTAVDESEVCLVPEGDVDALAKEISRLLGEPDERHRLATALYDRVVGTYSSKALAQKLVRSFAEVGVAPRRPHPTER